MATYMSDPRLAFGPVGRVEVVFEYDDGGTPAQDPPIDDDPALLDDSIVNVHWRNPNPKPASMVVTFMNSNRSQTYILTENTPDWQVQAVPSNLNARRGQLAISGPNYPATVSAARR